ncbi:hypothetical protein PENSPDRAFT_569981, partial [Peniophora sp. CONT]
RAISTGRCVSYNAEAVAITMAIGTLTSLDDASDIHIFADNKSALESIVDTRLHSSQLLSITACERLRAWLSANAGRVFFHWCPGHHGIEPNELVDGDVKHAAATYPTTNYRSHAFVLQGLRHEAIAEWRRRAKDPNYRGHQFLTGRGQINLSDRLKTRNTLLDLAGGSSTTMARLTRAMLNHAPTGEYRTRFHPREPRFCDCALFSDIIQTRKHILFDCPRYIRPDRFKRSIRQAKDPAPLLYKFLDMNRHAFSFDDAPSVER